MNKAYDLKYKEIGICKIGQEFCCIPSCIVSGNVRDEKYSIINEFSKKKILCKKTTKKLQKINK